MHDDIYISDVCMVTFIFLPFVEYYWMPGKVCIMFLCLIMLDAEECVHDFAVYLMKLVQFYYKTDILFQLIE